MKDWNQSLLDIFLIRKYLDHVTKFKTPQSTTLKINRTISILCFCLAAHHSTIATEFFITSKHLLILMRNQIVLLDASLESKSYFFRSSVSTAPTVSTYSLHSLYILYDFSGHKPDLEGKIQICFSYGFSRPVPVYKHWDCKSARPDPHVSTQKASLTKPELSVHWVSRFFHSLWF